MKLEGRSGQTLASGDPFEGLSSETVRIQLDERRSLHGSQERQPQALPETETGAQAEVEYPPRRAPVSEEELDPPPQPGNEGQCCGCRCSIMQALSFIYLARLLLAVFPTSFTYQG